MGLSITDAASLVTKGYKVAELNEVNLIVNQNPDDAKNIVDLAKKLAYPDFKSAMQMFFADTPLATDNATEKPNDHINVPPEDIEDDTDDDQEDEDDVDYKQLYEKEKTLREQIQKRNQNRDVSGGNDQKTDIEIAQEFCNSVLN